MAREITLEQPKTVEIVAAQTQEVETLKLNYVVDYGNRVEAQLDFPSRQKNVVLWNAESTPTYTEIGQWTDEDVDNRLKELL